MFGLILNKISHGINWVQFKVGEFLFPMFEPFFRVLENRNSKVKAHFQQALKCLGNNDFNVALLNLNMVLSLSPYHFLARVYRARVYLRDKRYQLAVEDYVQASKTSRFRFIHYELYREYFISIKQDPGDINTPINKNSGQAYKIMKLRENPYQEFFEFDNQNLNNFGKGNRLFDLYEFDPNEELLFTETGRTKLSDLGPITRKEIEATDWEVLSKKLSSKGLEP